MSDISRDPIYSWTIAPCFIRPTRKEQDLTDVDLKFLENISFLNENRHNMKVVLDNEGFLWNRYMKIIEKCSNVGYKEQLLNRWINTLNDEAKLLKKVPITKILKDTAKKKNGTTEITTTKNNCITIGLCASDILLMRKRNAIINNSLTEQTNLYIFDLEKAIKFFTTKNSFKSPDEIQDALRECFLLKLKIGMENKRLGDIYYDKEGVKREPIIGMNLFNTLKEYVDPWLTCSQQPTEGMGPIDCKISYCSHHVGIELKCAHSKTKDDDLLNGLISQLPEYLKALETEYGIYLILYFSTDTKSYEERQRQIEEYEKKYAHILSDYKINIYWIDCSKRPSASKIKHH